MLARFLKPTLDFFSRTDAAYFVRHMGIDISSSLRDNPRFHYKKLHDVDPEPVSWVPRGLLRNYKRAFTECAGIFPRQASSSTSFVEYWPLWNCVGLLRTWIRSSDTVPATTLEWQRFASDVNMTAIRSWRQWPFSATERNSALPHNPKIAPKMYHCMLKDL